MRFRILGPLEVHDGRRTVPFPAAKHRALLGALLLHPNEVVSIDRLVDELWGERPPATATKLVQGYVHALRKQLGADTLVTQVPGYRIRIDPPELDLTEFQRLVEEARSVSLDRAVELRRGALALWRGPPLADVVFEGPTRHQVGRLSELHLATQIELLEAELELRRHAAVVGELELLVAAHPYQERLRELQMLALYRAGRQADALEAYQETRRTLGDELGLEPGQVLRDLEAAILRQDPALSPGAPEPSLTPAVPSPKPAAHGDELRPVTALFADIVGSTALGERLPPEDVKALVGECVTQMSKAVEEYGGTVQAYEGDGICAYFGVPQAHEDDPERAARTALRIVEVVGEYAHDIADAWAIPEFAVRVGIDTGRAGVGQVGVGSPQTVALGDTVNVAARLQSEAAPGTITVGEETARRLSHRFAFDHLGELTVKGRAEPVRPSRLVGPIGVAGPSRLRPLVGRDGDLALVRSVVADFESGRGQTLLLLGEPGIGKTRMLAELRSLVPDHVTWLEGQCLSYGGLPSWPFVDLLRRWLGVELVEPEIVVRTRTRARLEPLFDGQQVRAMPGIARLLRIRLDHDSEPHVEEAEMRHAYVTWIEALAAQGPLVLAVEDLHWAHPSTRELAEDLLALTERAPLLLIATLRRDTVSEGWRFRTRVLSDFSHRSTELALEPLSSEAATEMLSTLLPGVLDQALSAELVARAEGNPFYLQELLRSLLEAGGLEARHRTWTTTLKPSLLLPPALESLLVARIDRLADGPRRLAQVAAVLGREFPVSILERVAGDRTDDDLAALLKAEIVRELRRYPELVCAFRHGLLQEAALSSLTPARRRELYGAVAAAVEEVYAVALDDHFERLAHYYSQSGERATARDYLERAAARADALGAASRAADLRARAARLGAPQS